jgi:uncharacterized membrane protein
MTTMESRLRIAGHAVHPVLVMFPSGLFATAVLFDLGNLLGGPALLGEAAYWTVGAAIVGGVLAAVAGVVDVMFIRGGVRAKRARVLHGLADFGVLLLFMVILLVRMGSTDRAAGWGLLVVELIALAGTVAGAWYGGALVDRLAPPAVAPVASQPQPQLPLQPQPQKVVPSTTVRPRPPAFGQTPIRHRI